MKNALPVCLLLLAACLVVVAQNRQEERILNLKGLPIFGARADGAALFLSVTGKPPDLRSLKWPTPTPYQRRGPSGVRPKVQVLFGKDILGLAEVPFVTQKPLGLAPGTDAPGTKLTTVFLKFETAEQAARAAEALRYTNATPRPLQKQKDEE